MNKQKLKKIVITVLAIPVSLVIAYQVLSIGFLWKTRLITNEIPAYLDSPTVFSQDLANLSSENIKTSSEISVFSVAEQKSEVVAISEDKNRENLMIANATGKFAAWQLDTKHIVSTHDFLYRVGTNRSTNFNFNGERLITGDAVVWDTENGSMIVCLFYSKSDCPVTASTEINSFGSYLDPKGDIGIVSSSLISMTVFRDDKYGTIAFKHGDCSFAEMGTDRADNPPPNAKMVSVDNSETYFAYILENGVVCVMNFNLLLGYNPITGEDLSASEVDDLKENYLLDSLRYDLPGNIVDPKSISFDPTRKWLAVLTDKELAIWEIGNFFFPTQIYKRISNGNTISFDRTGDLLAMGTKDGIVVYNVTKGKKIAEFEVGEVTALYFSRDNRLLIWGDTQGNVHLWGVPE